MKWLRCLLALALMVVGVQLVAANSSYAASAYDDEYHSTAGLVLQNNACSSPLDVTTSWSEAVVTSQYGGSFTTARMSGSWGVSLFPHWGMDGSGHVTATAVIVYWSESTQMTVDWMTWGYMVAHNPTHTEMLQLTGSGDNCTVSVSDYGAGYVSSNDGAVTNYVFTGNPSYPSGYAGADVVSQTPPVSYVAMGDSFSSGEGNPPFEYGSDTDADKCHRSSAAYPRLLENDSTLSMGSTAFVACSGATTSMVLNGGSGEGAWDEGPQTQFLTASTQIVTITIGGNDIGFKEFASACVLSWCDSTSSIYATTMYKINNNLPGALKSLYEQVLMDAPNAKVYVIDYPQVTPATGMDVGDPAKAGCLYLYNGSTYWGNGRAAHEIVASINSTIDYEVASVQAESSDYAYRLHYVNSNDASSTFAGHTVCDTGNSYFQNINQAGADPAYVFHPNANGQVAYKRLLWNAITGGIA